MCHPSQQETISLYKWVKLYIYIYSHGPQISTPLVNMIKEGCEKLSALLILLIFY